MYFAEYSRALDSLPRAPGATFDSVRSDGTTECFEGTRVEILKQLEAWMGCTHADQRRIFWLNGLAGIGKSTIARTICRIARERQLLGGTFFFARNDNTLSDAGLVIPSLAFQLAQFDSNFGKAIGQAVKDEPDCAYKGLRLQFDKLIIGPLSSSGQAWTGPPLVLLVLDALDECSSESSAADLLTLFLARLNQIPFQLRIFITSRPEHHIRRVFEKADARSNYAKSVLHDIEASIVQKDIERYLLYHLKRIPRQLGVSSKEDWPRKKDTNLLVEKSGKLFIYAATAIRFIQDDRARDPQKQMDMLVGTRQAVYARPYAQLDQLYHQVLRQALPAQSEPDTVARFRWIISCIVLLRDPLALYVLSRFTQYAEDDILNTLHHLHSIILAPADEQHAPLVYHPSFPDFITNPKRCSDPSLAVDVPNQERRILLRCLELMAQYLKRDILDVQDPSVSNADGAGNAVMRTRLPLEVQYACRFWSTHLLKVSRGDEAAIEGIRKLAFSHLLYWVEAMSLLQATSNAVSCIEDAHRWAVCFMFYIWEYGPCYSILVVILGGVKMRRRFGRNTVRWIQIHFNPPSTHLQQRFARLLLSSAIHPT